MTPSVQTTPSAAINRDTRNRFVDVIRQVLTDGTNDINPRLDAPITVTMSAIVHESALRGAPPQHPAARPADCQVKPADVPLWIATQKRAHRGTKPRLRGGIPAADADQ